MKLKNNIIERVKTSNLEASIVKLGSRREYFVSLLPGEKSEAEFLSFTKARGVKPLLGFLFGAGMVLSARKICQAPVSALAPDDGGKYRASGLQVFGVSGTEVKELRLQGTLLGYAYEDAGAFYALLGDIRPSDISKSPEDQTREVYAKTVAGLKMAGMDFTHVVRTWFYLDKLLDWYGKFNKARTDFFTESGIFMNLVPASTGIGAKNAAGAALTASFFCVKPKNSSVTVEKVTSPLQCEALNYKSAFSRAVELKMAGARRLLISGTASIFPDGRSAHTGNLSKQIELTMEVVKEILISRKMSFEDVTRSILYFKDSEQEHVFKSHCSTCGIPKFPSSSALTTVCRKELLFEIELDAIRAI